MKTAGAIGVAKRHKNRKVRKFLQHETQTFGINLGWTDDAEPATATHLARWFFARDGGSGPLTSGETVAIGNRKKPSFTRYRKRDVGVNLDWSDQPVLEWNLVGESTIAGKFEQFQRFASGRSRMLSRAKLFTDSIVVSC